MHVVGDLSALQFAYLAADEVGYVVGDVAVVEYRLFVASLRSDVVVEYQFVERTLQYNEYHTESDLYDGGCEHVTLSNDRHVYPVL
jgi:hypothetical protein